MMTSGDTSLSCVTTVVTSQAASVARAAQSNKVRWTLICETKEAERERTSIEAENRREMERPIGIEPTPERWQGSVLPLY